MGQQKSKQINEVVSEIIVNTTINNSKNCAQQSINTNNFKLVARDGGRIELNEIIIDQRAYTTLNCVMESTQDVGFDAELASTVTNEVLQELGWLATGTQKSTIENHIHNIIQSDNLIEDIQSVFSSVMNEQNFEIIVEDQGSEVIVHGPIQINQAIESSTDALMTSKAVVDITAYLENDVENIVEQEQSGFDDIVQAIVDFFAQLGWMGVAVILGVLIVLALVFTGGSGDKMSQQEMMQMMLMMNAGKK